MALKLLANNNAKSVLASGISASATVITVSSGTGGLFPQPVSGQSYFKLTIVDAATKLITEIMHVTSVSGDVMTVQRGQEGTAARVWSTNDIVANMLTAGSFLSCLQIANNFSEITAEGSEAVRQALLNLGSSDGTINGRLIGVPRVVTSTGMFTKTPGATKWRIRILGAGGGSSAAAATGAGQVSMSNGGGAGAYAEGMYDVSALTSVMITIGQGGKGGTVSSLYGEDGGTSSVEGLIYAPGGKAGLPAGPANPPFQPVANANSNAPTGWNIVGVSGPGAEAGTAVSIDYAIGSRGANSQLGVGAAVQAINNPAVSGGGYGSGASGCSNGPSRPVNPGADGQNGIVIIEELA
ncbi:glycine-rich domain-containing protein [Klebsiella michiganensis]|uniref:glycine-rich domain-containing protein n=1 Tax=Klebsiella michiganensis TaxID=1134687 RepID=UPI001CCCCC8C|nr:hypothetical protein [Klebsiella michiganensis]MBZ6861851.1 hypothetical protein [Klebsiella michiganensis]MBZ7422688.1 hypothetical protein [Klebsiella michiganensis]MDS7850229.1 hypothetical protein [Klebsiella michiganensis]MDS7922987.1 hypothetical protein [Klebsiella michiganensis]MDU6718611.1 hypothetical protein [Klebsiella michiganensis]